MRVFVTGATGFIGSAIVHELVAAGHQVLGLSRSDASARTLAAAGAQAHRGDLDDMESLRRGVALADGVIHTAFNHDFSTYAANCEMDRRVIEVLGSALAGSERPLVVTSGTALVAQGRLGVEDDVAVASAATVPRAASEEAAASVAARGVRVSVIRLPPSVHGDGDHGFVPLLIGLAREKGVAAYVGDGSNRWPAVHRLDAARLYRLVIELGAPALRYHGVGEEGVPMRAIAEVIGRRLHVPVVALPPEEAATHFGWFAPFAALDNPMSSRRTRELLGWQATGRGLIADLDREQYFAN